jgi:5-formyltetrahydrofolate cyclo-ligase
MAGEASEKATLREAMLDRRRGLGHDEHRELSLAIMNRLTGDDRYRDASVLHTYIDARDNEVATRNLVGRALGDGKRVVCPRSLPRGELEHYEIGSIEELEPGRFGLLEPPSNPERAVEPREIDLVLVPGIVFDHGGYRIGYGGGYYDRFLARLDASSIGLAFEMQLVERVPREPHDVPVDAIATERELIDCRAARSGR